MSKDPNKKGMSFKTKAIIALVVIAIILIVGFYLGMSFQQTYYSLAFSMSKGLLTFYFWLVIIVILLLACAIGYFVYKYNKSKRQ